MHLIYSQAFLSCHCGYAIRVPYSSPLGIDGRPRQITTDSSLVNVACPKCGLVSPYSRQLHLVVRPVTNTPDPYQEGVLRLVSTQVECDDENCEAPKTVHAVLEKIPGAWTPKTDPGDWRFDEDACCRAGHRLHRRSGRSVQWVALDFLPF